MPASPYDRIAVCQHPDGRGDYVPAEDVRDGSCFMKCDCTPRIYVDVREVERLREELRIARWDADAPIRELREEVERLREAAQHLLDHPRSAEARLRMERAMHGDNLTRVMAQRLTRPRDAS